MGIYSGSTTSLNNPVKFFVYRNAAANTGNGAFAALQFDAVLFDTGSNYDNVTNFRFTAPFAGFYLFEACASIGGTSTDFLVSIYKNGTRYADGSRADTAAGDTGVNVSVLMQLNASNDVEVYTFSTVTKAFQVGASPYFCYFQGFLVSTS